MDRFGVVWRQRGDVTSTPLVQLLGAWSEANVAVRVAVAEERLQVCLFFSPVLQSQ